VREVYLIDANILIEAKNRWYGFDLAPGFWDWLADAHTRGVLAVPAAVRDELIDHGDDLSVWVAQQEATFTIDPHPDDRSALSSLSRWAGGGKYRPAAVNEFLSAADYFLVAQAVRLQAVVVTGEQPAPQGVKRIKIPDACDALGVPWIAGPEMLRREGVRFGLK
jgi:hypothetical protein